ncbi:MAG: D-glycero-beta-D-manno-heptose-7-phosphate kinase [Nanoarchaeota archaeon]|nr:D-glycero-beta-D-manno-heptose-7-phosphate kinase [Nanoarchaeota archaeon]
MKLLNDNEKDLEKEKLFRKDKLMNILGKFKGKRVLVIGDIMLDKYIFGNVERISPEAPVQVVEVRKEDYVPGGAANVANNIAALDGNAIMIGVIGKDVSGDVLINELKKRNINTEGIFVDKNKPTTQKVRILGHQQQLLRIDYEKKEYLKKEFEDNIASFIKKRIEDVDAIIISDYAKGVITKNLMEEIKDIAKDKIVVVDPKPKHASFYGNVSLITPNSKEAKEMANKEDIEETGNELLSKLSAPILITRGEKGMSLFEKDGNVTNIPTKAKEVYDVSGAGDTTVATLALALAAGATLKESATIANHAAGITVGKLGTSTVCIDEIKNSIENE